ncbi:MAG TPA: RNA polymerase sigma factor [Planctomycetota bacterium]|nr:RNA polymerase sigma factor [Planctomycetota bacterium]
MKEVGSETRVVSGLPQVVATRDTLESADAGFVSPFASGVVTDTADASRPAGPLQASVTLSLTKPLREVRATDVVSSGDGVGVTIATERTTTDRELVLLARRGTDGDASFRVLYERHGPEVLAFVAHLVRDAALAEDVLQETFLRAHGALESYDEERSFRAWILGIARNAAIDAIRARLKRERIIEEKAKRPLPPAPAPVPEAERREEAELARAALDALPPESRALLIQRHGLDMKMAELAESLAVTEKTATARLRAALLRFTEALLDARGRS